VIDWRAMAVALAPGAQLPPGEVRATPVAGGNINRAYRLESGSFRFFVKLNRADREAMFVAERKGLEAICDSGAIRVPQVYLTGREGQYSYIAMEYIEMTASASSTQLAQALAAMHDCVHQQFGFHCDNTIGSTPQVNRLTGDWVDFWREHRLGFQLALARRNGLPPKLIDSGEKLAQELVRFFDSYRPCASLLHGDLWNGNWGADAVGSPVVYDPACYYGDHEADLAMMELFGNPGAHFFAVYREHFPIDPGYSSRRDLYNLYHLLNHANLFGGNYADQAQRVIEGLLRQLR
jgi:protein-ribulosamine 3-kinase